MKLHILSDLHNEFGHYLPSPTSAEADVIVLAGDIWKQDLGIYWARKTWPNQEIVYVAGNHEFYGRNRKDVLSMMRIASEKTGVHFLDNEEVNIGGVRFLGATLWTDFKLFGESETKLCMGNGQHCLNDFRIIYEGTKVFSPMDSIKLHEQSIAFLKDAFAEDFDGQTVVVTHHLPSELSVADRFKKDYLSACFASHLDRLFGNCELWIHGHTHDSFDYTSNGTRVVCNPRGYNRFDKVNENGLFKNDLIISLSARQHQLKPSGIKLDCFKA